MKQWYMMLLTLMSFLPASGQLSVTFQTLPRDGQLFPRNAANQATIVAEGTTTDALATRLTMRLDRSGKLTDYQQATFTGSRTFRFATTIRAELAEYDLRLYLHRKPGDSVLVAERKRLLCGDVFLIYGQSNAFGLENLDKVTVNDQFMRQVSPIYGQGFAASMEWFPATQPYGWVGCFGLYLAESIQKVTRIPIALINGAEGGASIGQLSDRNATNPADVNTFYGRMLYRAQWAGAQNQIRGIFYKQGENEAGSSPADYPAKFDRLYRLFRQDYGTAPRLYVGQINLLVSGSSEAGTLRDFQRRLPEIYPDGVTNIATVGSIGYDGLHYDLPGSRQIGYEQGRQVLRDVYGSTDTDQIDSPNVRQVYQNAQNDTLTVVFEPTMQMTWPADSTLTRKRDGFLYVRRLVDILLADGQTDRFVGGRAEANRVFLALKQPGAVQTLTYFPPFFGDGNGGFYDGPTLKNRRGMRAFTFDRYPVARALPAVTTLAVARTTRQDIALSWTVPATDAIAVLLERAAGGKAPFTQVARLPATANSYTDTPTGGATATYLYRIRLVGQRSESPLSNVVEGRLLPPCALSATISGGANVPFGGTLTLSAVVSGTESTGALTYQWRGPGGLLATTPGLTQPGMTPEQAGPYSVTVTQGACTALASVSVTVQPPLATENLTDRLTIWPNPVRAGQSVQIDGTGATPGERLTVALIDGQGRRVFLPETGKTGGPLMVPIPGHLAGRYLLEIRPLSMERRYGRLLVE